MKHLDTQRCFTLSAIMLALSSSYSHATTFVVNAGEQVVIDSPFTSNASNIVGTAGDAVRIMENGSLTINDSANITSFADNAKGLSTYAGSTVTFNGNTDISTSGSNAAHAVQILQDVNMFFNGDNNIISVNGAQAYGLLAAGAGANVVVKNALNVNTNGNSSIAVVAQNGANVNLGTESQIKTGLGNNAYALYANGTNAISKITAKNISIDTSGLSSHGVYSANGGGQISLSGENNKVITNGEKAYGLIASRGNSSIIIDGSIAISTTGLKANGVTATNNVTDDNETYINLGNNSSIKTTNYHAYGIASVSGKSRVDAENITILTSGDESIGLFADSFGVSNLIGNNSITTIGESAHGIMATNNAIVNAGNTQIETSGMNADAIFSGAQSLITLDQKNAKLYSINGYSFNAQGGTIDATLNNSSIINNGILINAEMDTGLTNVGIVNVNAKDMVLNGDIQAGMGSQANLSISNTQWNGVARNGGQVGIGSNAIWNMMANSDVAGLTNSGTINFSNPVAGDVLTVHGDYIGNNGYLLFNTELNDDNSVTDKMIVEGNTSGNTLVNVTNAGGNGAATLNGIELIQVNGQSDGDFVQSGRIVAGVRGPLDFTFQDVWL